MNDYGDQDQMTTEQRLLAIEQRLDRGAVRMTAMQQEIADNTEVTKEVRDILQTFRTGFKVAGWIGTGAKWVASISAAVAGLWALFHLGDGK
jgi:hypothetical protein